MSNGNPGFVADSICVAAKVCCGVSLSRFGDKKKKEINTL